MTARAARVETWFGADPTDPTERRLLARLENDLRRRGVDPTPRVREEIWAALGALAQAPVDQRTLTVFSALVQDKAVAAALEPLTLKGPHGALVDGVAPASQALAPFECFELETLMATPSAVAPVLAALFHEIERGFDGRPTLLILDEASPAAMC